MVVRRLKSYTGETGFVYQYYFVGKRDALPGASQAAATEYIFDVTSDRKSMYAVSVFVERDAVHAWAAAHGRELTEAEQYAAAKMRLFRGFDEIEDLAAEGRRLLVEVTNIGELLSTLGLVE